MKNFTRNFIVGLYFLIPTFFTFNVSSQCNNYNTQYPAATQTINAGVSNQTISTCMYGGEYAICSVVSGATYTWTTCGYSAFDTQITVKSGIGGTLYAYNDDACGLQSTTSWVATFTGNVYVLISQYNCTNNTTCMTLLWSRSGAAENTVPATGNNSYSLCSGVLYDHAGSGGNYANNVNGYTVINPAVAGNMVRLTGTIDTESGFDFVRIYNGVGLGGTLLYSGSGSVNIGTITSTSGPLTVQFTSDGSVTYSGFALNIACVSPPAWKAQFVSMNTGSSNWCVGETRTVSVTVTNTGTQTWTNAAPDINIGIKWNAEADYFVRVNANGLAPGATQTYNLTVTAPAAGVNNLTFDVVNEGNCWFGNNNGSCGPGNTIYTSPLITINPLPSAPNPVTASPTAFCTPGSSNLVATSASVGVQAGFAAHYAPANWTISHTPITDVGTVNSSGAPNSISVTSSNGGNMGDHSVFYTITVPAAGNVTFNWSYTTTDWGPSYDFPQYAINGVIIGNIPGFNTSGANSQSGSASIAVGAGQTFSFVMTATDDILGAATTIFSNFTAPAPAGATISWFTVPTGGASIGTSASGVNFPVTPGVTTTYYAEAISSAGCVSAPRVPVTVTVNTPSVAPTSITGVSTMCGGGSTTLTLSGGTAGTGAIAQWFSGSCGGTSVGTGNSISVSPGSTTTYFVRYAGTCNTTGCASVTVTVSSPSTAPISITGTGTYCIGNSVTLTQSGGTLAGSSTYNWFTGSCGGTWIGTGPSIVVSPSATTTYYVSASANGSCPATACASGVVTMPAAGTNLSNNNESATCVVNQAGWVHFYHSSGRLIASVNSGGQNLGNVSMTSYIDGAPVTVPACNTPNPSYATTYLQRHWVITPTIQPTTPVQVRLPYGNVEFSNLSGVANTNSNGWDDVFTPNDIKLTKYSGPLNVNSSAIDNCPANGGSGGSTIHSQSLNGLTTVYSSVNNAWYTDFTIPGFSEFWLHGSMFDSPLPVTLTSFAADCKPSENVFVKWITASENNSSHFLVERSIDGTLWEPIGQVAAAGNSTSTLSYQLEDMESRAYSSLYYRLQQYDNDGASEVYGPVVAHCSDGSQGFDVYPNPAGSTVTVVFHGNMEKDKTHLVFYDLDGKEVKRIKYIDQTSQLMYVDIDNLAPGCYIVRLFNGDENHQNVRLIKQ